MATTGPGGDRTGRTSRTPVTPETFEAYKRRLCNWGRWGDDDQRGCLNHMTADVIRSALALVRDGVTVSCANPLATRTVVPSGSRNPTPTEHRMHNAGPRTSNDMITLDYHGFVETHLDALCHFYTDDGKALYNGRTSSAVTMEGAASHGIDRFRDGILTRGVLYDIPRLRGTDHVGLEAPVQAWDLADWAERHRLAPRAGDAVLIRSGSEPFWQANPDFELQGPPLNTPGVAVSALEFLHDYDSALLVWDLQEAAGQGLPARYPIHEIAIPYMGLPLLDNANLEMLSRTCARLDRYEFLFVVAPLVIKGGTGSPVNPIAVL